jgi:hypothetical protein
MFGLITEGYALHKLFINLDNFIDGYISYNPNFALDILDMSKISIKSTLFNLIVNNYVAIVTLISLMLQIMLKFYFNKNINNIYI